MPETLLHRIMGTVLQGNTATFSSCVAMRAESRLQGYRAAGLQCCGRASFVLDGRETG